MQSPQEQPEENENEQGKDPRPIDFEPALGRLTRVWLSIKNHRREGVHDRNEDSAEELVHHSTS